jgi:8-amino-7-oxononanoate synthase
VAVAQPASRGGAGAGAAPLVTGHMDAHQALEKNLAEFKGTEDCVVFSSGYLANLSMGTLVRQGDAVFSDARNHASIIDGCRLSRAEVFVYGHRDVEDLERQLAVWREGPGHGHKRALVVTDSVFSMDGDLAPLLEIFGVCQEHSALLWVDEAHATGVVGKGGRGAVAHFGLSGQVQVVMGTLSKSLGSSGGFLCGSRELCDLLRNRARPFMFDTALAPTSVAAANTALQILQEEPERVQGVRELAQRLATGLRQAGWRVPSPGPDAAIVPIHIGEPEAAVRHMATLQKQGILVPAIRPPAVPPDTARLRATVTASHSEEQVDRLIASMGQAP